MAQKNLPAKLTSVRPQTQVPSTQSAGRLLPAAARNERGIGLLERLCSAKKTLVLTPHEAETWLASLSIFDFDILLEVILRIAHSEDPFPDLGKLFSKCEDLRRERAGTVGQGTAKLGTQTVKKLAEAWGYQL